MSRPDELVEPDYEVVYRWPDGREEVRYRRPNSDQRCRQEVAQLRARLGAGCPYSIREITSS
jgi:hypothetical protein